MVKRTQDNSADNRPLALPNSWQAALLALLPGLQKLESLGSRCALNPTHTIRTRLTQQQG